MTPTTALRDFLEIPYDKLEELNLEAKQKRLDRVSAQKIQEVELGLSVGFNPAASPVGMAFKVVLGVVGKDGKPMGGRSDRVALTSSSKSMKFSSDGGKWTDTITVALNDGKGSVMAMDTSLGGATVSATGPDLSPDSENVTIMPAQKTGRKMVKGKIKTKDGKELNFIQEYRKP